MAASERYFYGTGRRKTAVARVRLYPGSGEMLMSGVDKGTTGQEPILR